MRRTAERLFGDQYVGSVGGNVRVGLEASLWDRPGHLARSNAALVTRIRTILEALASEVATPDDARQILKLKGRNDVAF